MVYTTSDLDFLDQPRDGLPDVTNTDLDRAVLALRQGTGPFAVDTERAMGIRYSSRAYLIQIKRAGAGIFLIDPLGIEDRLGELARVMDAEWILHAADQDLPSLRELGLEPQRIFDTELAGLILGFERVSLQAMIGQELGIGIAKEYSDADWSQRPLGPELRAYAALDVDLLLELRQSLIEKLHQANRWEWFVQECDEVRLRPPRPPHPQPWRKIVKYAQLPDQRALAMLRELWTARDHLAKTRDLAPGKILPNKLLANLAARKPRSLADVKNSSLLRTRARKRDADFWWEAINRAWSLPQEQLPERRFEYSLDPFPPVQRWEKLNPDAAQRWAQVRQAVLDHAQRLGIRQEVLLKPRIQKQIAWHGWEGEAQLAQRLAEYGARPWQINEFYQALATTKLS
ncbi:HRDC domain-containing protein [Arcanobacterium pinnipediorum]|uniref:HRDC domain-containing protein n=1 Tax=Arcanobacterium pinnipediorum TaxID=1503041 RepID=A0ABY5AL63_9ACTO|nr:HRDC domain-containing protein [Arcanobacterium pinnipediorum]USR80146.1 HRDC domain-containing protein [Arcanobacterium pinnipediorum]